MPSRPTARARQLRTRWCSRSVTLRLVASGALVLGVMSGSAVARPTPVQSGHDLERPPHWKARYDDGSSGEREYVVMRPGWHVHPGPAGLFWDPGKFASGNYAVSSTIFLFPPNADSAPPTVVDNPYGLFLAGDGLDGEMPSYVTFLIRSDGRFRIARRVGDQERELVPWTEQAAIVSWTDTTEGTAENVLSVNASDDTIEFGINDITVATLQRAETPLEGLIGLRVGEGLSLHITEIAIGPATRQQ